MKKTLLFLFCGIAALCVSCKEGDDAATRFSFSLPEVVSVGSTTADVNSRAGFTLNDYPGLERGFAYGPADEAAEGYRTVKVTEFERNAISARLTGLDPETSYRVHAYVKLGASRILSDGAEFTTLPGDGGGDGDGDGDGDGVGDGGGVSGPTRYSGWPELLAEQESNSDYYYAYHLCPDLTIRGYKARNYSVCFSAEHHCPVWVAAPRHACYEGTADRTMPTKPIPISLRVSSTTARQLTAVVTMATCSARPNGPIRGR